MLLVFLMKRSVAEKGAHVGAAMGRQFSNGRKQLRQTSQGAE